MKPRSEKKIEALIRAAFPNAGPFRSDTYGYVFNQYRQSCKAWERYRDSICPTTNSHKPCICATDPRLKDHPLRLNFQKLVNEVNRLDREAYDKLVVVQNNLRGMYRQVNVLKEKFHNSR